jgi:hypothetical protein
VTGFEVGVLFSSASETLRALKMAQTMAAELNARISLIYVQVVPYPLPLEHSPVDARFLCHRLRSIANQAGMPIEIQIFFGRDVLETLHAALGPETIVIAGHEHPGWFSSEQKLIKRLLKQGHSVVLAERPKVSNHPLMGKLRAFRTLPI